jgi:presenilin-like A22 family membrane protease
MRGSRTLGLLGLYVGAQIVALFLAAPFRMAGLATTSNPNSATDPIYILVLIVAAPLGIIWVSRRSGGFAAIRGLLLVGIAGSLDLTLSTALSAFLPSGYFAPAGAGEAYFLGLPIGAAIAVLALLALIMEPQWYVVDAVAFVAGGALIALLGISFGILPSLILLSALAVYDAIAVYVTKHMISLADVVTEMKLPILMVMPDSADYDYTQQGSFKAQRAQPVEQREAVFMGLGDVVIPGTLVASAFVWLPPTLMDGIGANLIAALAVMGGSLVGYAILMWRVSSGNPQAGLPFLNGGAILGYILAYVLLFHSFSLGISL